MSLPVLTAVTGAWEAPLITALERARGEVHVVRRCADLAELLAAAQAGLAVAAVVSGDLHRLDREAIGQLRHAGVAVVGLADPLDPDAVRRLRDMGAGRVLPADATASAVAAAVADVVKAQVHTMRASTAIADPADALIGLARPGPADLTDVGMDPANEVLADGSSSSRTENGRIVAVWGPTGAPGRTTVAVTLAGEFAELGAQTLVIDADTYGPSVAQVLGLLDESGGIAGAVRSANQGMLDVERLARLTPCLSSTLRVLTGLPQPSRWPELRPAGLDVLWQRARELARWTVVDCGFGLETDEEISFDTAVPRRNGATLSALAAADVVLAVGGAEPVGLQRLVRGLDELGAVLDRAFRPRVVVTRVRPEAVGREPERRIAAALARYAGVGDVLLIPDDRVGCDAAMLAGRMLVEAVPDSVARRPLTRLAETLDAERSTGLRSN